MKQEEMMELGFEFDDNVNNNLIAQAYADDILLF
jgi:hypothetical protein